MNNIKALVIVIVILAVSIGTMQFRINVLAKQRDGAYKDGFEAGSKTVTCNEEKESAFNDGLMDGLKRAKTMCGITVKRSGQ